MDLNYLAYGFSVILFVAVIIQYRVVLRLKADISLFKEKVERLGVERDGLVDEAIKSKSIIDELKTRLDELDADLEGAKDLLSQSESRLKSVIDEKSLVEQSLSAADAALNKLRESYEDVLRKSAELNAEFLAVKQKFLPISSEIDDAIRVVKSISELEKKLEELNIEKNKLESDYVLGRGKYQKLVEELATLEDRLELYSFGLYEPHFSFDAAESYKDALNDCYGDRRKMVKEDRAATCNTTWTVNGSKVEGRKNTRHFTKIMLRAFNGECDAALLKVRWNNVKTMEERIKKSFDAINELGRVQDIRLSDEYLQVRLKELWLTHEYHERIHEEKEEQRRLREQMREEERSLKEMEAARQEAEKEEARYTKALEKARKDLEEKHGEEKRDLELKIIQLEKNISEAVELKNRAISMAQITKAGYVYVISNIGSFGEDVFKIGMTRRLEPSDRVRELSGASVPFSFDIHAMIYSNNAPELENNFHRKFKYRRLNLVNGRKEFFNISLQEIADYAKELNHEVEFTKLAEARDYRETKALKERMSNGVELLEKGIVDSEKYPVKLFDDLDLQNRSFEDEDDAVHIGVD